MSPYFGDNFCTENPNDGSVCKAGLLMPTNHKLETRIGNLSASAINHHTVEIRAFALCCVYSVFKSGRDLRLDRCNRFLRPARSKGKVGKEVIMARSGKFITGIAAFTAVWLASGAAMASNFQGELPVGYSDSTFQMGGGTSFMMININAIGVRDPAICGSCNSIYTDNFTVNLFNQAGTLLQSVNETNFLYYNMYSSSRGIGAGPIGLAIPAGATTLEIVSRLSIAGLLGSDGNPLSFGNLIISTNGSLAAATRSE